MSKLVIASDGRVGRKVGKWNDEKLRYIRNYVDIFATGMKKQWDRLVYADFFCGPGVCVTSGGVESAGSPLIAARRSEFAALFLNDLSAEATEALSARLPDDAFARSVITQMDCNDSVERAREVLFPPRSGATLGLAVIDPHGFEMEFESIARLTAGRVRLDLLITVMSSYPQRFLQTSAFQPDSKFDRFMGNPDWERLKSAQRASRTRVVLDHYRSKLEGIGYWVDDSVTIKNTRGRPIYQLVYASRHARGFDFWEKAKASGEGAQQRMGL